MKTIPRIGVIIENGTAVAFEIFQRYWQDIVVMHDAGVFEFRNGSKIIHRDSAGRLRRIVNNVVEYDL